MSEPDRERLYHLLPAIYRLRDAEQGYPLRALLGVLESELRLVEDDVGRLYDNWFIETCDEWVVPYLGDLLGVRGLLPVQYGAFSQRALVANTLAYRRAKGTAAVLEQLARDVTGWPAKAVEFFELLAATQHLNHVRSGKGGTANVRDAGKLELLDTPFQAAATTAEVRHIDNRRGKYNIPNAGIFLWRLPAYAVTRGTARSAAQPGGGCYRFHPLGIDAPLFNWPRTETGVTQVTQEENVPGPLRRRALHDELEERRQALVAGRTPRQVYFGHGDVFQIFVQSAPGGPFQELRPEEVVICHLGEWRRPVSQTFTKPDGATFTTRVAVDPVLGRIAFPTGTAPHQVEVNYRYGLPGDLGGGPYDRRQGLEELLQGVTWQMGVTREAPPGHPQLVRTLTEAVQAWNQRPEGYDGVIALLDSRTYEEDLTGQNAITIPKGSRLVIAAGDWPEQEPAEGLGPKQRVPGRVIPSGRRPHLLGNLSAKGTAPLAAMDRGELVIDGLWIEGALTVLPGNLGNLKLRHSTLVPGLGGLAVNSSAQAENQNSRLAVAIERSLVDRVTLPEHVASLEIRESIIAASQGVALAAPATRVEAGTIAGPAQVRSLDASNSIFLGVVRVARRQLGCVRFSYLPLESTAPRRYRCQPECALSASRVTPQFTSLTFGQPGYGQLAASCPSEIASGADDEGEMGAFHFLEQSHRMRNLQASLDEYLRFGLEAGVFFVT